MVLNEQIVPTLDHVVGQARAVAVLKTAIDAYFFERSKVGDAQAFPHTLITGPAGTGKTLLSEIVSRELAANLHIELAQNIKFPEQVHGLLMLLEPGDVLFLDEVHELPQVAQVTLYRALEDGKLFLGKKQVVNLLNLAPDIQEAILHLPRIETGRAPVILARLQPIASTLDWRKQRAMWNELVA